ncbi:MAG: shikimate dehydrogenase [Maricaulaceae bacterium]|jgi:shikimate dehydrogenase
MSAPSAKGPPVTGAAQVAGVAGWPIAHSLSPVLHNAWIAAAGLDAVYAPFAVRPEQAAAAFKSIAALGLRGLNVTVPHKEAALAAADEATPTAQRIGAANLLTVREDRSLLADNTDAHGFLDGLARAGVQTGERAVLLGAGGAARAVVAALADAGWRALVIVNRDQAKAAALCALATDLGLPAQALGWDKVAEALNGAGLVVNATSLGMTGAPPLEVDLSNVAAGGAVYDLVYTPRETALLKAARARGLVAVEGLDMLIGQARPSFEAFFGAAPPESIDARALLEQALGG